MIVAEFEVHFLIYKDIKDQVNGPESDLYLSSKCSRQILSGCQLDMLTTYL